LHQSGKWKEERGKWREESGERRVDTSKKQPSGKCKNMQQKLYIYTFLRCAPGVPKRRPLLKKSDMGFFQKWAAQKKKRAARETV